MRKDGRQMRGQQTVCPMSVIGTKQSSSEVVSMSAFEPKGDVHREPSNFGWTFTDYGSTYCEFSDGRLTGGFAKGDPMNPGGPLVILYADDLSKTQTRLEDAGARIVKPVFAFPGGRRFHFHDLDGYELAVWSDK